MPLLIRNGDIVTADARVRGDIYVESETITAIGSDLVVAPGTEVIDASGKLVFPGFIDPHVHIYLPFMATFARDTHETASVAALVGGTTTFIEMCCPSRNDDALEGYRLWKAKAASGSAEREMNERMALAMSLPACVIGKRREQRRKRLNQPQKQ